MTIPGFPAPSTEDRAGRFAAWVVVILLMSVTIEGPLRFFLWTHGKESLLYARDALVVIALGWNLAASFFSGRWRSFALLGLLLFAWGMVLGYFYTHRLAQVGFGVKVMLPLALGFVAAPTLLEESERFRKFLLGLIVVAFIGAVASAVYTMPWEGLSYQIAQFQIEGNRQWMMEGLDRVSGFSRASFNLGFQLLFFTAFVTCFFESRLVVAAALAMSGCGIYLTTNRATLLAWIILAFYTIAGTLSHRLRPAFKLTALLLAAAVIILPLAKVDDFREVMGRGHGRTSTSSMQDRLREGWPRAFNLIQQHGNPVFGRGLGGIGAAQKQFEPDLYNSGDNLFVYLYVCLGLLGGICVIALPLGALGLKPADRADHAMALGALLALLAAGLATNCLEDPVVGVFSGLILAVLWSGPVPLPDSLAEPAAESSPMAFGSAVS